MTGYPRTRRRSPAHWEPLINFPSRWFAWKMSTGVNSGISPGARWTTFPGMYDSLTFPEIEKQIPQTLVTHRFLFMPLWQWIAIAVFLPVALLGGPPDHDAVCIRGEPVAKGQE